MPDVPGRPAVPRLSVLLWASVVLAFVGVTPGLTSDLLVGSDHRIIDVVFMAAFIAGPAWIILTFLAIRNYGKRGLWVLIGIPSLFLPLSAAVLIFACWAGIGCV